MVFSFFLIKKAIILALFMIKLDTPALRKKNHFPNNNSHYSRAANACAHGMPCIRVKLVAQSVYSDLVAFISRGKENIHVSAS